MKRVALALLAFLFTAAGCGPLPQPFQPLDKNSNGLIYLEDGAGITVLPLTHDAPLAPGAAAELLADALRKHNVPAWTRGWNAGSRILTGRAVVSQLDAEKEEVLLYWELNDAQGVRIGSFTQRRELEPGTWRSGDQDAIAALMDQAAGKIASMVQGPNVEEAVLTDLTKARLVILPMLDLPGDGTRSLARALKAELQTGSLPVVESTDLAQTEEDDLLIACTVTLSPSWGAWQDVTISWLVTRARDGSELGRIDQQNQIPMGQLDGPWGVLAYEIAAGAVLGIRELIGRLDRPT